MTSSRASLYENPPKLPDAVLQDLLAQARQEMTGNTAVGPGSGGCGG